MHGGVVVCCLVGWVCESTFAAGIDDREAGRWAPWTVVVTAYCPCDKCCGRFADGQTASGIPADGKIIAAAKWVPFNTVIRVPGYGTGSVQDRGRAIQGDRLDVLYKTHAEAKRFGRRRLTVSVWIPAGEATPEWLLARTQDARKPDIAERGSAPETPSAPDDEDVDRRSVTPEDEEAEPLPATPDDEEIHRPPSYRLPPNLYHVRARWQRLRQAADERQLSTMMRRFYRDGYVYLPRDLELHADLRFLAGLSVVIDVR